MQIELLLKHIDLTAFAVYTIDGLHDIPFDRWIKVDEINIYRTHAKRFSSWSRGDMGSVRNITEFIQQRSHETDEPYWLVNFEDRLIIRTSNPNIKPA